MVDIAAKEGVTVYDPDAQATRNLIVAHDEFTREEYQENKTQERRKMAGFLTGINEEDLSQAKIDEALASITRDFNRSSASTIETYGDPDGNHVRVIRPINTTPGIRSTRVEFITQGPPVPRIVQK